MKRPAKTSQTNLLLIGVIIILLLVIIFSMSSIALPTSDNNIGHDTITSANVISSNNKGENIPASTKKKKVAYAITVTKDGHFVDGALVLGYSAKKVHDKSKGFDSEYDADLVAFVTSSVQYARPVLTSYGWKVIEKPLPVQLEEIQNSDYMNNMKASGCCGADEFLKLWAYTLIEYERVIHLDMDSIVYQNMDELYKMDKELIYTGDWNMKSGSGSPVPPVQGGFLVIKPSLQRFQEFQSIIREGNYNSHTGWGNTHIGAFWGGQTIQGILPYFYYSIHPGDALEVNRCVYNCMVDNPYRPNTNKCLTGEPTCEDCRLQEFNEVKSAHFTICQKPWTCTEHNNPKNSRLCTLLHAQWFTLRDEFEHDIKIDTSYRTPIEKTRYKESLGMCSHYGDGGYISIPLLSSGSNSKSADSNLRGQ